MLDTLHIILIVLLAGALTALVFLFAAFKQAVKKLIDVRDKSDELLDIVLLTANETLGKKTLEKFKNRFKDEIQKKATQELNESNGEQS